VPAADALNYSPRLVVLGTPVKAKVFRLSIGKVHASARTQGRDLALSEWTLLLEGQEIPPALSAEGSLPPALAFLRRFAAAGAIERSALAPGAALVPVLERNPRMGSAPLPAFVREKLVEAGAEPGKDHLENFAAVARAALLDAAVTVVPSARAEVLIGQAAFTAGAPPEEYEFFPAVALARPRPAGAHLVSATELIPSGNPCGGGSLPDPGAGR
jgi:hypothetical protein